METICCTDSFSNASLIKKIAICEKDYRYCSFNIIYVWEQSNDLAVLLFFKAAFNLRTEGQRDPNFDQRSHWLGLYTNTNTIQFRLLQTIRIPTLEAIKINVWPLEVTCEWWRNQHTATTAETTTGSYCCSLEILRCFLTLLLYLLTAE